MPALRSATANQPSAPGRIPTVRHGLVQRLAWSREKKIRLATSVTLPGKQWSENLREHDDAPLMGFRVRLHHLAGQSGDATPDMEPASLQVNVLHTQGDEFAPNACRTVRE